MKNYAIGDRINVIAGSYAGVIGSILGMNPDLKDPNYMTSYTVVVDQDYPTAPKGLVITCWPSQLREAKLNKPNYLNWIGQMIELKESRFVDGYNLPKRTRAIIDNVTETLTARYELKIVASVRGIEFEIYHQHRGLYWEFVTVQSQGGGMCVPAPSISRFDDLNEPKPLHIPQPAAFAGSHNLPFDSDWDDLFDYSKREMK